jgi:eukaryotic-like serine/threonine-protein kinase
MGGGAMAVRRLLVAGRYRLHDPVGTGGMGRVWLARDEMLDRDVAVKEFVPPDWMSDEEKSRLRDRTLREARSAGRLNHPHVVRIYDVVHADGLPWIVMEYVPSRSLHQVIREDGPYSPAAAARIGLAVLDALTAAHQAGVLHRDVKPHNVLIGTDGRVVLTDFGLATFVDDGAVTGPGLVVGSPQYVSPERARDGASTVESDLWSLGATLYAAVEGHSPYARENAMATLTALATEPPDPPERAGLLAPVLTGLLRHEPTARLTATEVERRLRMIIAAATPGPAGGVGAPSPRRASTRAAAEASLAPDSDKERGNRSPVAAAVVAQPERARQSPGRAVPAQRSPRGAPAATSAAATSSAPVEAGPVGAGPVGAASAGAGSSSSAPTSSASAGRAPAGRAPAGRASASAWRGAVARLPRPTLIAAGIALAGMLGAAGVMTGYLLHRDHASVAAPLITASSAVTASPLASAASLVPVGFTTAVCHGPAPADAPRAPQPDAARGVNGWALPAGWSYFSDGTGFHIAVPDEWTYQRIGTTYCFRDPGGSRLLSLDVGRNPKGDPVTACEAESARLVRSGVLPDYQKVSIERRPLLHKAADWQYRFNDPDTGTTYAQTRWFASEGKAFALGWSTREIDWIENKPKLDMVLATFYAVHPSGPRATPRSDQSE